MNAGRSGFTVALLGSIALAVGCLSGPGPTDHYYRLEPDDPATVAAAPRFRGTLEVERFRSDALTDGTLLLYRQRSDDPEVERYAYHHWADPPTIMLQRGVADHLRKAGAAERIVTPEMRVKRNYSLLGRIVQLEQIVGDGRPRIILELELSITRDSDHSLVIHQTFREEIETRGTSVAAAVEAYDQALARILARFLESSG